MDITHPNKASPENTSPSIQNPHAAAYATGKGGVGEFHLKSSHFCEINVAIARHLKRCVTDPRKLK